MSQEEVYKRREAKIAYAEILRGYSVVPYLSETIYIKHLTELDMGSIEVCYDEALKYAASKKLPTSEEKLNLLNLSGDWTEEEENELNNLHKRLEPLDDRISKIWLESQKKALRAEKKSLIKQIEKLSETRRELLGLTAEGYAEVKKGEEFIRKCLYKDKDLNELLFTQQEFDKLSIRKFSEIIKFYNETTGKYTLQVLKRIAVQSYFLNNLFYCKDNAFAFFGIPAAKLSINQSTLFSVGMNFKAAFSKGKQIPAHLNKDLDEMIKWLEGINEKDDSGKPNSKKAESVATGVVGATKEETQEIAAAEGGEVVDLRSELDKIKEEKGEVNIMDFLRLHGKLPDNTKKKDT